MQSSIFTDKIERLLNPFALLQSGLLTVIVSAGLLAPVYAQQSDSPVIVQPGAPGQPTKVLPATTRAVLPPRSAKDIEFSHYV